MVTDPVASQFIIFLYTILTGALVGFVYDIYAGCSHVLRLGKTGLMLGDLIYWLAVIPLVYALLLRYNQGEVRFFVLLGLGLGAGLYFFLFRKRVRLIIVRMLELIIRIVRWVLGFVAWLAALLFWPFRIAYQGLTYPLHLLKLLFKRTGSGMTALARRLAPASTKRFYHWLIKKQPPQS